MDSHIKQRVSGYHLARRLKPHGSPQTMKDGRLSTQPDNLWNIHRCVGQICRNCIPDRLIAGYIFATTPDKMRRNEVPIYDECKAMFFGCDMVHFGADQHMDAWKVLIVIVRRGVHGFL